MSFKPSNNLVEQIADYITQKIIYNEFKPGSRIFDSKLAEEMGVSRTPVREAIRLLERNRLVEVIPRKGVVVTEITAIQIEWLHEVLEQLYGLAARKAAEGHTEDDLMELTIALRKIEKYAQQGDTLGYYDSIFEYAAAGLKAAKNPLLESLIKDLWPANRRIQHATLSQREDNLKENVKLFQKATTHFKQRNAEQAELTIREYVRTEKEFAIKLLMAN